MTEPSEIVYKGRLFVDDERPKPDDTWDLVKTDTMALLALDTYRVYGQHFEIVSLDHDLGFEGDREMNTRAVMLWMCEHDYWPKELYVHTGNISAEEWLVGMAQRYAPPGTLKGYGLNFWGSGPDSRIQNWLR